jgi:hypothetical protein
MSIDIYLERMPALSTLVTNALQKQQVPFKQLSILLVHHLSSEIIGTIGALRKLECVDVVTVFVGYNPALEEIFAPALSEISDNELRFYVLSSANSNAAAESFYSVSRTFIKEPSTGNTAVLDALDANLKSKSLDFMAAMRALIVQVSLAQMARARGLGHQLLVVEDGGYSAPIFNDAALQGISVDQFRNLNSAPPDTAIDKTLPSSMDELVREVIIGSVEHTRNGYDLNMRTFLKYGKLAAPAFSIAVSYMKTQIESDTAAATILNATESVLYSIGVGLRDRNVLVFGSRGNLGRRLMKQLGAYIGTPMDALIGCDLKVGQPDTKVVLPRWQFRPSQSSAVGSSEVSAFAEIDSARASGIDLIIGVTGGPTPGHPVLQVKDIVEWLTNGAKKELYIASGSTKTDEFPELLAWLNSILKDVAPNTPVGAIKVNERNAQVEKTDVTDLLSKRSYGSRYVCQIQSDDGQSYERPLILMANLTPVNFLFYGEPTEVIDQVLAQLMTATFALVSQATKLPELRVYAVDFDPEATAGVYGSRPLPDGTRIPLPLPAQS